MKYFFGLIFILAMLTINMPVTVNKVVPVLEYISEEWFRKLRKGGEFRKHSKVAKQYILTRAHPGKPGVAKPWVYGVLCYDCQVAVVFH